MGFKTEIAKTLERIDEPHGEEWDEIKYTPYKDLYLRRAEKILAKMREVVEGINSIGYPYGADFKQAILKAMDKEGK